jgi:SNF2 family DNA or RNA helicase
MHYEVFKYESERIALLQGVRRIAIILDESQKIKNPNAALSLQINDLREGFVRRVIMTGTPVSNRPYDIWSQVYFLDGGRALGDFARFRDDFDFNDALGFDPEARARFANNLTWLHSQIKPFSVRETKISAGIDLPKKHIERLDAAMAPVQATMYDRVRVDLEIEIQREGSLTTDSSEDILKRMLRLVQVASNPALLDERYHETPGKLVILTALLNSILAKDTKAIVWTTFVENAKWLRRELRDFGSCSVHGAMAIEEREKALRSFMEDKSIQVLIATTGAAKEGLTLTVANHAIFYDRSFSLDDFLQAQDRIHRISQERECYIYVLSSRGSIDEWIDLLIDAKRFAAQLAQGDISIDEYRAHENYRFFAMLKEILKGRSPQ